jgi:hypothetical protein
MKKFGLRTILAALLCTLLYVGSAFALNATDHVSVAPNGKGDALIFPAFFTGSGWETKLVVTNSSLTTSVVAKVVVRSKENSQELLDFLIFLSPSDVWTGTLMNGAYTASNGATGTGTYLTSSDDSVLVTSSTFATSTAPFVSPLVGACTGDTNELGYVTVIEGHSFALAPNTPGVAKSSILAAYNAYTAALNPINSLTGQCEVVNTTAGVVFGLNATALKNHDYNITDQIDIADESFLGVTANNTTGEVEAALAKDNIVVPYYSGTAGSLFSIFTFPTKYAALANCVGRSSWTNQFAGFPSPVYGATQFDLSENSTTSTTPVTSPQPAGTVDMFTSEVNYLLDGDLGLTFTEGWVHIDGTDYVSTFTTQGGNVFTYTGFPVIATSMRFGSYGNTGWLYDAHTLGTVNIDGGTGAFDSEELNYHYWGQTDN